jgi:aldose 1-epimerase
MHNSFSYEIKKSKSGGYPVIVLSYSPTNKKDKPQTITIAPTLGSNLFSWRVGTYDIIYHEPKLLKECGFTGNFVLFPTPNRVNHSTYVWAGKKIVMKKRGKLVELHGLVIDEAWDYTTPVVKTNCVSVKTTIAITRKSDMYSAYPFPCVLTLEYILYSNKVKVIYMIKNTGTSTLPFGFGLHPYFSRLSGNDKTQIQVPAKFWMESPSDTLLPTGTLVSVQNKPYDLRKPVALNTLNLDHVLTGRIGSGIAQVMYQSLGFKVQLISSKDFTHFVVYTGHTGAVCIENQTCSTDAINLWDKGFKKESHLLTVAPGGMKKGTITYAIKPI